MVCIKIKSLYFETLGTSHLSRDSFKIIFLFEITDLPKKREIDDLKYIQ